MNDNKLDMFLKEALYLDRNVGLNEKNAKRKEKAGLLKYLPAGAAACILFAAVLLTVSVFENRFVFKVYGSDIKQGVNYFNDPFESGWFLTWDEDETGENVFYELGLPIRCSGKNIKKITYEIEGSAIAVREIESERILVDSVRAEQEEALALKMSWEIDEETTAYDKYGVYSSFSILFENQNDDLKIYICGQKALTKEIKELLDGKKDIGVISELFNFFFSDTKITCKVEFQDGKTAEEKISFESNAKTFGGKEGNTLGQLQIAINVE